MQKAAHNMPPKRLSLEIKKIIALDALSSNTVSDVAKKHSVTRKTAANHKTIALDAINKTFDAKAGEKEKVLFWVPVTNSYIKMIITLLFVIAKVSIRDSRSFIENAFDHQVSTGYISQTLDEVTAKADAVNQSYSLSGCKTSATDELFHQDKPTLATIDIESQFCMSLVSEESRDETAWGCYLLDMMERGYSPNTNVMDGGTGMLAAFKEVLPNVTIRYDHFHIIKDIKEDLRFLKNKKESAMTEAINISIKMDKAKKKKKHQKYSVKMNTAMTALEDLEIIYQQFKTLTEWLQYDVLQLQSVNYQERLELFDFVLAELKLLANKHPHRIKALATKIENQKEKILDAAYTLNQKFDQIATKHKITLQTVWDICNLTRFSVYGDNYHSKALPLETLLGDQYDVIEDEVLITLSSVHRSSSMIENFNSRLKPYLDPRKGFKKSRYALIQFALNHLPIQRSAHKNIAGRSPAEVFSKKDNIDFLPLLAFQRFRKVA